MVAIGALLVACITVVPNLVVAVQRTVDQNMAQAFATALDPDAIEQEAVEHITALATAADLDVVEGPVVDRQRCELADGSDGERRSVWLRGRMAEGRSAEETTAAAAAYWRARDFDVDDSGEVWDSVHGEYLKDSFVEISFYVRPGEDGQDEARAVYEPTCMPPPG